MAYLIVTHPGGRAAETFDALVQDLQDQGWTSALDAYALAVLVRDQAAPPVAPLGDWQGVSGAVVGEIFSRAALDAGEAAPLPAQQMGVLALADPLALAGVLRDQGFGDYVVVVRRRPAGETFVFTDPLGGRPAFSWNLQGVTLIGDEPPEGLAAPTGVEVDWEGLADVMADRRRMGAAPPLKGVTWIAPGTCRYGPGLQTVQTLWTPAMAARRGPGRGDPEGLRRAVDGTLRAQLLGRRRVLCEISGGLDSAIVATSLRAIGRPADAALNFYRGQAEADERPYALAAAERASAPLRCVERTLLTLTADRIMAGAGAFRPNFEILDTDYDDLVLDAIEASQADVVFTGHGGDVVFYQLGAAELAGDLLLGAPCEGSRLARLADIALRTRRSVWSLATQTVRGRPSRAVAELMSAPTLLAPDRPEGLWHPWVGDLGRLPPAKRAQIRGLALTQGVFAHTRRAAAARHCHPLLSQPVVEQCLATSTAILSQGEGERSFARRTFADRLPESIVVRRSKGDISVFFGRTLAKNVPVLRDFLLDGRLVAKGILDRKTLEAVLSPEVLIFRNAYAEVVSAAVLEAFARYWEGRDASSGSALAGGDVGTVDSAA